MHAAGIITIAQGAVQNKDGGMLRAMLLLLFLMLGALGLLLVLTLVRWSVRRRAIRAGKPVSASPPLSPWQVAGQRAMPEDDSTDLPPPGRAA